MPSPSPIPQRRPRETAKAVAAFTLYRDMGPERSLAAVAAKLGKSKTTVAKWSSVHHWQSRLAPGSNLQPSTFNLQLPDQLPVRHSASDEGGSPMNSQLSAWQQQPNETNKNFAAFNTWLALGPTRTLARAAAATGRTKDQLAHWSARWRWTERAAAYHAHLAAVERKATEDLVAAKSRDWAAMHESVRCKAWAEGEDLIALAQEFKARWRESDRLPDFGALIRAIELAFKLKQFAAGMPSEIKAVNTTVTGPGGAPIRIELEAALNKIYGNPIPGEVVDVEPVPPSPAQQLDDSQPSTLNPQLPSS